VAGGLGDGQAFFAFRYRCALGATVPSANLVMEGDTSTRAYRYPGIKVKRYGVKVEMGPVLDGNPPH